MKHPLRLQAALAFALFVAAGCATLSSHSGESHGEAQVVASRLKTEAAANAPSPIHLLVLGDSIAMGQGASDPRNGFAFVLYRRVLRTNPGSEITNRAIGGTRIADVERLELSDTASDVDLIIIEAGANDVVHGASPASVRRDAGRLFRAVERRYPETPVIVCGIPDLSISPIFTGNTRREIGKLSREDDAALRAVAFDAGLPFVDLLAVSQRARAHPETFLGSDDFHPSDRGHAAIAALLEPRVDALLR